MIVQQIFLYNYQNMFIQNSLPHGKTKLLFLTDLEFRYKHTIFLYHTCTIV